MAFNLGNTHRDFQHARRGSWVSASHLALDVLITSLDLLGIEAPERM